MFFTFVIFMVVLKHIFAVCYSVVVYLRLIFVGCCYPGIVGDNCSNRCLLYGSEMHQFVAGAQRERPGDQIRYVD